MFDIVFDKIRWPIYCCLVGTAIFPFQVCRSTKFKNLLSLK